MNKFAYAYIKGYDNKINGRCYFYRYNDGTIIDIEVKGLPDNNYYGIFPIHIHEGLNCNTDKENKYNNIYGHYNPKNVEHPYHAGDLPDLYSNNGYAYMKIYTKRLDIDELNDLYVIIHENMIRNFGKIIACGKIYTY